MPKHDLVVIGGGPGGYVAAIRAAQLGLDTACIEKESALGGTCLRVGCIPSKALLESSERYHAAKADLEKHGVKTGKITLDLPQMLKRKDETVDGLTNGIAALFKKNKVTRYSGHGRITGPGKITVESGKKSETIEAERIIIATGSVSSTLPNVEPDGDLIGTSTEALSYPSVPKKLVVIGAGYIGLELGSVWARLGSEVTVLEYLDRILPGMDAEVAKEALKIFKRQGLAFKLGAAVTGVSVKGKKCSVEIKGSDPIECDRVLLSVGRKPNTESLGLEVVGISLDDRGRIPVNERFETAAQNVFAIGDVIRGPMLAHKAEEEGAACVEGIVNNYCHVNYDAIPGVVYTEPEIASVGKSEETLKENNIAYKKGIFHFRGNGRARALGSTDGFCKILADETTDRILGVHIIGPRAGDMIAEAVAAIEFGASSEDIARTSHAHPTLAEVMKEAAMAVQGKPIHA
ncbi:MAG: dihydrolipoyl dehydrogenase [Phycisphaerae bacterium]